ncbi:amidase [Bordetella genomosp. 11]|uniref:Amidase n=1 Tax=Bordetella genomosp. 11 TaxID=1416808 RepID=A0A261UJF1_9BORD|nr:amidase [Bordetella genomosp. 11]OZI61781.1 amidase [Bordetella genomosp. 11]
MNCPTTLPSIAEALCRLETGELRARDLAQACLQRIQARDAEVQAYVAYDANRVLAQAGEVDSGRRRGLLRGVPFAVKDVIQSADYPTTYGSPIYAGHRTGRDAACVALSREQGGVLMGKVVTSEFATQTPGPTRNPLNPAHTPGGSSSGSAAAVADGMAMVAWGTQTTGSITRPAIYCGVVGYKPSFGLVSTAGVGLLSPLQDTVGILARDVGDAAATVLGIHGRRFQPAPADSRYRLGVCLSSQWDHASAQAVNALHAWIRRLAAAGFEVSERALPADFEALIVDQGRLVAYDARHALAHERRTDAGRLSPRLTERMAGGEAIDLPAYLAMQQRAALGRHRADALFEGVDALVYPATDGEAEAGLENSGSPRFGALWTLLHLPTVALPVARGSGGLPLGVQLVGRYGQDEALLQIAERAASSGGGVDG